MKQSLHVSPGSYKTRFVWGMTPLLYLFFFSLNLLKAQVDIPDLNWTQRSDWINVKTDVTPAAVGDGVTDDTAALQAALNRISNQGEVPASPSNPRIVYLPPGTYRITQQLTLTNAFGSTLIGHGRSTTIKWDGAPGGHMLWQNGVVLGWFYGITWDGGNTAADAIYDSSDNNYETALRHQDEKFLNFTQAGLFLANQGTNATADSMISNCLFQNCDSGILLGNYNVYVWNVEGCEFSQCGVGIRNGPGNSYVRDCHFSYSREADITTDLNGPTVTISRCTSVGSYRFFWSEGGVYPDVECTQIRDCRVEAWTCLTGAMQMVGGPTIADCIFTLPPCNNPPINVSDSPRNSGLSVIVGGNSSPNTSGIIEDASSGDLRVLTIPNGSRGPSNITAHTHFIQSTESLGGQIFDAKVQFGAKADGVTDDSAAIQATINAAKAAGSNAIAYFPAGDYAYSKEINITGSNYRIEGSSLFTRFAWKGGSGTDGFLIHDAQGIFMRSLNVLVSNTLASTIHITSTTSTSQLTIDRVLSYDYSGLNISGTLLDNLAPQSQVHIMMDPGSLFVNRSSQAQIYMNYGTGGTLSISGVSPKTGFFGTSCWEGPITIQDNNNFVCESLYSEASVYSVTAGGPGTATDGALTIGMAGAFWIDWTLGRDGYAPYVFDFPNYGGRVYLGGHEAYNSNVNGPGVIRSTGTASLTLSLVGDLNANPGSVTWDDYGFQLSSGTSLTLLGRSSQKNYFTTSLPDQIAPGGLSAISAAWDDLRQLGQMDLAWNFPTRFDAADPTPPTPNPAPGVYFLNLSGTTFDAAQTSFYAPTLQLATPANDESEYFHLVTEGIEGSQEYGIWYNHEDANGPYLAYLNVDGTNASILTGTATNWNFNSAPGGNWYIQSQTASNPQLAGTATTLASNIQVLPAANTALQQWALVPVTLPPAAPFSLSAILDSSNRYNLTWRRTGSLDNYFSIQRQVVNGTTWQEVGRLASSAIQRGTCTWIDPSPLAGTSYTYRVCAVNNYGSSAFSNSSTIVGAQPTPTLLSAVSRFVAGTSNLDLPLALTGSPTIEPRTRTAGSYQLVLNFSSTVTAAQAALQLQAGQSGNAVGTAQVSSLSGSTVTVNLSGIASAQRLDVHLTGISPGNTTVDVPINILLGDTNGDGYVTAADVNPVKTAYGTSFGQAGFNLRADINGDGYVTAADINPIKNGYGTHLP